MALKVGELFASMSLDTKSFDSGLSKAAKSLAETAAKIITVKKAFDTALSGIQYNAQIEQLQTSFEVMSGSAAVAADTVQRLKDVGAATPYDLSGLAQTTQLLMNYGFTAEDAVDQLLMLGDVAQGDQQKLTSIATGYAQMSSAAKVNLQDIKQMINGGFNPLQEISESTGESMESLYDRISKGSMDVLEITASIIRSTSEGGKYFKSMEKQSKTLNGQFSTMKDNWNAVIGTLTRPINDVLTDTVFPGINDGLEEVQEALESGEYYRAGTALVKNVMRGIKTFKSQATDFFKGIDLSSALKSINISPDSILTAISNAITNATGRTSELIASASVLFEGFLTNEQIWGEGGTAQTLGRNIVEIFKSSLTLATTAAGELLPQVSTFIGILSNGIGENTGIIAETLGDLISTTLTTLLSGENIRAVWDFAKQIGSALWEGIKEGFSGMLADLFDRSKTYEAEKHLKEMLSPENLRSEQVRSGKEFDAQVYFDELRELGASEDQISELVGRYAEVYGVEVSKAVTQIEEIQKTNDRIIEAIAQQIVDSGFTAEDLENLNQLQATMLLLAQDKRNESAGLPTISESNLSVGELASQLMESLGEILGEGASSSSSSGAIIGENFSAGIANGIRAGIPDIVAAATEAANAASAGTAIALDEHSPSRVGFGQGLFYVQGIANGITESVGLITDAVLEIGDIARRNLSIAPPVYGRYAQYGGETTGTSGAIYGNAHSAAQSGFGADAGAIGNAMANALIRSGALSGDVLLDGVKVGRRTAKPVEAANNRRAMQTVSVRGRSEVTI